MCCLAVSHIIRDTAAGRSGPITPIGLGTFVDPREQVQAVQSLSVPSMLPQSKSQDPPLMWLTARTSIAL